MIEMAFELIATALEAVWLAGEGAYSAFFENVKAVARVDTAPLSAQDQELVAAVVARRGVSPEAAEELVRWLRTQRP